jgi:hypothetical protein
MIHSWNRSVLALGLAACTFLSGTVSTALAQEMSHETTMADARPADLPRLPLERDELVEVRTVADDRTVEFVIGPLELEAGMEHLRLPIQMAEFPVDGWMHGFEMEMVDGAGDPIPAELLHHVNFIDPDKRELFSPIARRVMAAGRETSTQRLPAVIGYPIADGDRMLISAMFANPLERDFEDAHLVVRFFYSTESDRLVQPRDIFPFYLDVMGPLGPKDFPLPPGRTVTSWEGKPAVDGRILGIGGHVHDYATRLALIDVTDGKTLWEVEPDGTPGGRITGVPSDRFLWTLGKKIDADHVYRIEVEYHNPLDEPAPDGGMGAIGGAVWVGKDVRWPEFDRTDEVYIEDLANTLTAPDRLHGHGHGGMSASDDAARGEAAHHDDAPADEGAPAHDAHGH